MLEDDLEVRKDKYESTYARNWSVSSKDKVNSIASRLIFHFSLEDACYRAHPNTVFTMIMSPPRLSFSCCQICCAPLVVVSKAFYYFSFAQLFIAHLTPTFYLTVRCHLLTFSQSHRLA